MPSRAVRALKFEEVDIFREKTAFSGIYYQIKRNFVTFKVNNNTFSSKLYYLEDILHLVKQARLRWL